MTDSQHTSISPQKKLPIGIQTLREIRQSDYYYIDKTPLVLELEKGGKHYFLSRPRRFGKSLLIDTLKELFEGNKELFKGLAAEHHWDWSLQYAVIRFSFGSGHFRDTNYLPQNIAAQLEKLEAQLNITARYSTAPERLQDLILTAEKQSGLPVVVLIDEYDKPILDTLTDPEAARINRDFLRGFYGVIKDYDAHVRFSFLTGVSKFSKVSLFSGLNNLLDITLDPAYSALCGYTDYDVDTVFAPELAGLDREEIQRWYNGYHWLGDSVYNPFDILQLFKFRRFDNYWFETGTPTFLIDLLFERHVPSLKLNEMISSSSVLSSFDVDQIATEALLFQTGYLTIKHAQRAGGQTFYTLGYPNQEVYQSLNESLLAVLVNNRSKQSEQTLELYQLLMKSDFNGLKSLFHRFFASIPHHWYTRNDIQNYEGYYASVFYSYFASLGLDITLEDVTNLGRIDMTLRFNGQVYIFEFKVVEDVPEGKALQQIKERGYADKYVGGGQAVHLIGVEFSRERRNILRFEVESPLH